MRANALKCAGDAALYKRSRLCDIESQNPVCLSLPMVKRVLCKYFARFNAHLKVVDAEIDRVGVGYIHSNQRNAGTRNGVRNQRRNPFLNLELDDQIYALCDKFLCVLQSRVSVITIVANDQLDSRSRRCSLQAV